MSEYWDMKSPLKVRHELEIFLCEVYYVGITSNFKNEISFYFMFYTLDYSKLSYNQLVQYKVQYGTFIQSTWKQYTKYNTVDKNQIVICYLSHTNCTI